MLHDIAERTRIPDFGTLRLTCREVTPADLSFYGEVFDNAVVAAQRGTAGLSDTDALLRDDIAHWRRQGFGRWCLSHAGHLVGLGGLTVETGISGLRLDYYFVPDMWGQGLASEFVRGAIDYAGEALGSEEIYGLVRPENIASIRVMEKAGFRDAGLHSTASGPMRELRLAL